MPQTAHHLTDEPTLSEGKEQVVVDFDFRPCHCNSKPHGYLWAREGSKETRLPIVIPSITAGTHLIGAKHITSRIKEDSQRLEQQMRDAGLPESIAAIPEVDIALIEHQLAEFLSPISDLVRMMEEVFGVDVTTIGAGPDFDPSRLIDKL